MMTILCNAIGSEVRWKKILFERSSGEKNFIFKEIVKKNLKEDQQNKISGKNTIFGSFRKTFKFSHFLPKLSKFLRNSRKNLAFNILD
jgi:hypothetical protein